MSSTTIQMSGNILSTNVEISAPYMTKIPSISSEKTHNNFSTLEASPTTLQTSSTSLPDNSGDNRYWLTLDVFYPCTLVLLVLVTLIFYFVYRKCLNHEKFTKWLKFARTTTEKSINDHVSGKSINDHVNGRKWTSLKNGD